MEADRSRGAEGNRGGEAKETWSGSWKPRVQLVSGVFMAPFLFSQGPATFLRLTHVGPLAWLLLQPTPTAPTTFTMNSEAR